MKMIMEQTKIVINWNGTVSVPDKVMMQDFEIAELFEVMIPTIRSNVRAILKSEVVIADMQYGGTVIGATMLPDYHGLDMIIALAFRIQSPQTEIFRKWILGKATEAEKSTINQPILISIGKPRNQFVN